MHKPSSSSHLTAAVLGAEVPGLQGLREYLSSPCSLLYVRSGQFDADIVSSIVAEGRKNWKSDDLADMTLRLLFARCSCAGQIDAAFRDVCLTAVRASSSLETPFFAGDIRPTAVMIRAAYEFAAVYWKQLKHIKLELNRALRKHQREPFDFQDTESLCVDLNEWTARFFVRGGMDALSLWTTGTLKLAQNRHGYIETKEIDRICAAVKNLAEFGFDAELYYKLLSELTHPTSLGLPSSWLGKTVEMHRGYRFGRYNAPTDDSDTAYELHTPVIRHVALGLSHIADAISRMKSDTMEVLHMTFIFQKLYVKAVVSYLARNNPPLFAALRSKLEEDPYEVCVCLSGQKFKFCCRPAFLIAQN